MNLLPIRRSNFIKVFLAIWAAVNVFLFLFDFGHIPEVGTKAAPPFSPTNASSTTPSDRATSQLTNDLSRILDPLNDLVAGPTMTQLHHGTYAVVSPLADGSGDFLRFAFKTECRPPGKWHGQQGWTEAALHHFERLLFADGRVPHPRAGAARGVVLSVTPGQLAAVVHRDRCGVIGGAQSALEAAVGRHVRRGAERGGRRGNGNSTVLLIGIALEWQGNYDDDHVPEGKLYAPYFAVPPDVQKPKGVSRQGIFQMSDVFVLDYLMLNPDRASKNWFFDKATHSNIALIDNGWSFGGDGYKSSICSSKSEMLECPSLLQHWSNDKRLKRQWGCKSQKKVKFASSMEWCRFRPETLVALNRTRRGWYNETRAGGMLSSLWLNSLRSDVLMAFLLEEYHTKIEVHRGEKLYSTALARFVHLCPPFSERSKGISLGKLQVKDLLVFLEAGVRARMDALADHAEECLRKYGESYVYCHEVN